jgi:hypothetical protein
VNLKAIPLLKEQANPPQQQSFYHHSISYKKL